MAYQSKLKGGGVQLKFIELIPTVATEKLQEKNGMQ